LSAGFFCAVVPGIAQRWSALGESLSDSRSLAKERICSSVRVWGLLTNDPLD